MNKKLNRFEVGALPLMEAIVRKMNLRPILADFFPKKEKEGIASADLLMFLIYNLTIGKTPLYELEEWVESLDLRCLRYENYQGLKFSDDRFGKALDLLFKSDRSSLMTRIVTEVIKSFNIDLRQLHNDSTSVKAFGEYSGKTKTGFELKRGKSKDYRPDLKQLIFSLSICSDGAIPIHFKTYPGNTNDDSTHVETWKTLCQINQNPDFLYVADCKLCTDNQLSYISDNGGRALTTMPDNWKEVVAFKDSLRKENKKRIEIWRKTNNDGDGINYFYSIDEKQNTIKRGYKIIWICSSERQKDDLEEREKHLRLAKKQLTELALKLNKRKWKSEPVIRAECERILKHHNVARFIKYDIETKNIKIITKQGRGRPKKGKEHEVIEKVLYMLKWSEDKLVLKAEKNVDGVYPLLSTDPNLTPKEAIIAYKYQPKLEKRFSQLKSIHNIAPLFCKKLERVEANMFVFFVSLMIQALIEREVRMKMKDKEIAALKIYPERRDAAHPTTAKILESFSQIYTYKILDANGDVIESYADDLRDIQKTILKLLSLEENTYWHGISEKIA